MAHDLCRTPMILTLCGLLACAASPESESALGGSPDHAGYHAGGNEPFWTLTFGDTTMEFHDLGGKDTVRANRPAPERRADGWRFSATFDGAPFVVLVQDGRCSDSMSGRPFPHTVIVTAREQTYTGCGGDTASLLTGAEWHVTRLDDAATIERTRPTLRFATDGSLTGNGGCNLFHATYEITGEGIAIGPAAATRRACAEAEANAQESRFFALLEQVTRFEIAEGGNLVLLAMDHPVIVAQR